MCLEDYSVPKLVFREGLLDTALPSKQHILFSRLYVHTPDNVTDSIYHQKGEL
jgi:hypothetical protein